jgi:effector-binding domain-containing protein
MNYLSKIVLSMFIILAGTVDSMATEEAKYDVVFKTENIEIRDYASHIVAETTVEGSLEDAGSDAFKLLFNYISGGNRPQKKIAMTAPVSQQANGEKIEMTAPVGQQREGEKWIVSFMMPASYTMETLPEPESPEVTLRQIPERWMAAIRYSGFWSEEGYRDNKTKLEVWIRENGLKVAGDPMWARYDPPFTPWFLRRNEVLIPIVKDTNIGKNLT